MKIRNTFAIFLVSGFWHGANWTFIIWGVLNALYFLPLLLTNNNRNNLGVVAEGKIIPSIRELFAMLTTFTLTVFAWIFFRANDLNHAISFISGIFSETILSIPVFNGRQDALITLCLITVFIFVEWIGRKDQYAISKIWLNFWSPIRYTFYYAIVIALIWFGGQEQQFIYFQF